MTTSLLTQLDLPAIFKLWIYITRLYLGSPFTFVKKHEIKTSTPWCLILSTTLLTSITSLFYINIIKFYPDNIQNPFKLLGYGRVLLFTASSTIRIIETVKNVKLLAIIVNKLMKLSGILPLNKRKQIGALFFTLIVIGIISAVTITRALPIIYNMQSERLPTTARKIFTLITDISLAIIEVYIISLVALSGFFFDLFQIELDKLGIMSEKFFLRVWEIPHLRKE